MVHFGVNPHETAGVSLLLFFYNCWRRGVIFREKNKNIPGHYKVMHLQEKALRLSPAVELAKSKGKVNCCGRIIMKKGPAIFSIRVGQCFIFKSGG